MSEAGDMVGFEIRRMDVKERVFKFDIKNTVHHKLQ